MSVGVMERLPHVFFMFFLFDCDHFQQFWKMHSSFPLQLKTSFLWWSFLRGATFGLLIVLGESGALLFPSA